MLRIITEHHGVDVRMELHGTIAGEWVGVLERQWRQLAASMPSVAVTIGLSNVLFIDGDGERLLRSMARRGVAFEGAGLMNRYVIDKISGGL